MEVSGTIWAVRFSKKKSAPLAETLVFIDVIGFFWVKPFLVVLFYAL